MPSSSALYVTAAHSIQLKRFGPALTSVNDIPLIKASIERRYGSGDSPEPLTNYLDVSGICFNVAGVCLGW